MNFPLLLTWFYRLVFLGFGTLYLIYAGFGVFAVAGFTGWAQGMGTAWIIGVSIAFLIGLVLLSVGIFFNVLLKKAVWSLYILSVLGFALPLVAFSMARVWELSCAVLILEILWLAGIYYLKSSLPKEGW